MRVCDTASLVLSLARAVGPAVRAANRDRRLIWADDRGANISYDTLGADDDVEGGVGRAIAGGDAIVEAMVARVVGSTQKMTTAHRLRRQAIEFQIPFCHSTIITDQR